MSSPSEKRGECEEHEECELVRRLVVAGPFRRASQPHWTQRLPYELRQDWGLIPGESREQRSQHNNTSAVSLSTARSNFDRDAPARPASSLSSSSSYEPPPYKSPSQVASTEHLEQLPGPETEPSSSHFRPASPHRPPQAQSHRQTQSSSERSSPVSRLLCSSQDSCGEHLEGCLPLPSVSPRPSGPNSPPPAYPGIPASKTEVEGQLVHLLEGAQEQTEALQALPEEEDDLTSVESIDFYLDQAIGTSSLALRPAAHAAESMPAVLGPENQVTEPESEPAPAPVGVFGGGSASPSVRPGSAVLVPEASGHSPAPSATIPADVVGSSPEPTKRARCRSARQRKKNRKARKMGNVLVATRVVSETTDKPDNDVVGTPSPRPSPVASPVASSVASPVASPVTSPVALPAASPVASSAVQTTVPQGRRNKKKKKNKRAWKKKSVRNAEPVGTPLLEASTEPQSTDLAAPVKEYVEPCIVNTESWRQRKLAEVEKEKEKAREAGALFETAVNVGGATAHSDHMSESSDFQIPMQGQLGYYQRSQEIEASTEYRQLPPALPVAATGAFPLWPYGFPPVFFPGAPFHSVAPQRDILPAALIEQASAMSESAGPESSLGEPVSEPLIDSEGSVTVEEADMQSSSLYFDAEMETTAENGTLGSQDQATNEFVQSEEAGLIDPLACLTWHLNSMFGNPELADIQLFLSPESDSDGIVFPLHSVILAASPFLRSVMAAKSYHEGRVDDIRALTGHSFASSAAFVMALRTLYGTPLVGSATLRAATLGGLALSEDEITASFSVERAMVDFALCYAATGAFLARHEITQRGIDMALEHLSWETAEVILNFGINPADYMVTCPEVSFSPVTLSLSSSGFPVVRIDHFDDFQHVQADRAQTAALKFITGAITPDFELYHRAQARFTPTRIPPPLHTLPYSACRDFRLEKIRFGSMPSYADLRPKDPAILVPSAMLITLPYRVLRTAAAIMREQGNLTSELLEEVMKVREERRLQALREAIRYGHAKVKSEDWAELGFKEFVDYHLQRADSPHPGRVMVGHEVPGYRPPVTMTKDGSIHTSDKENTDTQNVDNTSTQESEKPEY
ncbi:Uncharacterized protein PECH_005125 [Penicillium ucsense]|uniref:BTB domain-containing protein n=1 Tax=Penicillium ucsense TaxID=2839758 RepID=A0A8J8WK10_9EURO|nr:Uncharacterized protein PECM_005898 [Penicillium ucsense]KAF7736618.1 Uncharacterized protein PECH_005125 [Penicillium ucsense]